MLQCGGLSYNMKNVVPTLQIFGFGLAYKVLNLSLVCNVFDKIQP